MENGDSGEEMFSLELEPELVTGLYETVWQERRLVKLTEVPPLLIVKPFWPSKMNDFIGTSASIRSR